MRTWYRPLLLFTALMAATGVASLIGLLVDDRVLLGAPIWLKPLKFSISFVAFGLSWAWLLSLPERLSRRLRVTTGVLIGGALLEMVIIIGQVVRGRQSHFNATTPLDGMLYNIMGGTVVVLLVATLLLTIRIAALKEGSRPERLAIRFGMVISLVGMAVGILMTTASSGVHGIVGAHSVGVRDGGPGLPLTGWSVDGGDLRIGHFIGMHALQALPLLAIALRGRAERAGVRIVWTASLAYLGVVVLVTWQALRGQSIIHPDWQTGLAAGVIAVGVLLGLLSARTRKSDPAPTPTKEPIPA
ncbi:hypothetical protein [Actinokineospora inagensis]|uniref:hypothetical protein n=1 Tax=Actinokineospora inagensis TaxID=103730 RepID=UPI0006846FA9|nr:hypothetical protein [Actinokineospora inagensis]